MNASGVGLVYGLRGIVYPWGLQSGPGRLLLE